MGPYTNSSRLFLPQFRITLACFFFILSCCMATTLELQRMSHIKGMSLGELKIRDQLRDQQLGVVTLPLTGAANPNSFGFHMTRVRIGNPPREFNLLVDTTSSFTWVTCNPCNGCPTSNHFEMQPGYDLNASISSSSIRCGDHECAITPQPMYCPTRDSECGFRFGRTMRGHMVSDDFHLRMVKGHSEMNQPTRIIFGCTTLRFESAPVADALIDGVLALGPGEVSVITQLYSEGIESQVFSHCLGGDSGGKLVIGGEIQAPGIVYTELDTDGRLYNIDLHTITVGGRVVPVDPVVFSSTYVDSGTTLAILPKKAYGPFIYHLSTVVLQSQYVRSVISNGYQYYQVSRRIEDIFPDVAFHFKGGASMVLKPKDYLIYDGTSIWCIGFQPGDLKTILGELVLKDKIVIYDVARMRLGWTHYDCSQNINVTMRFIGSASSLSVSIVLSFIAFLLCSLFG